MKFKKILKYFIIVLIILSGIFIGYVYITLVSYENGIPENIIIKKINDQQYLNDIQIANNYESNYDVYKYISDLLSSKKGEIKTLESNDKNITFGIIEDKQLLV